MLNHQSSLARAGALNICPASSCDTSEYVFVLRQGHYAAIKSKRCYSIVTKEKKPINTAKRLMVVPPCIQF